MTQWPSITNTFIFRSSVHSNRTQFKVNKWEDKFSGTLEKRKQVHQKYTNVLKKEKIEKATKIKEGGEAEGVLQPQIEEVEKEIKK